MKITLYSGDNPLFETSMPEQSAGPDDFTQTLRELQAEIAALRQLVEIAALKMTVEDLTERDQQQ